MNIYSIKNLFLHLLILSSFSFLFSCRSGEDIDINTQEQVQSPAQNQTQGQPQDQTQEIATELISADAGGNIDYQSEVKLEIPPGSLQQDTEIGIEKLMSIPTGAADGFSDFGQAYRFSPSGTEFSLSKPAILSIKYNNAAMIAKGLDPQTLQIYYFDEVQKRFINVASQVNMATGKITALVEHFTIYLPLAKTMVPGNNAPIATLQNPVPNPIRAEASIYVRATARDFDLGGAVSGVKLFYRKLQPTPGIYQEAVMTKEVRPNVLDTFTYLIPSTFLTATDLGSGNDIEYYIEVTDNLGTVSSTAPQAHNVDAIYTSGSLTITPAVQNMSAGFELIFTVRGVDNLGTAFTLVPENVSVNNSIGSTRNLGAGGQLFQAENTAIGSLQAELGTDTTNATITVYNGSLASMQILNENSQPFSGTFQIKEGQHYEFDVIGYDMFDNSMLVIPNWMSDPILGQAITQNAQLYTLDGNGFGKVTASLGTVSTSQWLHVLPRNWVPIGGELNISSDRDAESPSIAFNNTTPYVAWSEDTVTDNRVYVKYWGGNGWIQLGTELNLNALNAAYQPDLAFYNGRPYVVWTEYDLSVQHIYVKYWDGANWISMGGSLNVDSNPGTLAAYPSIAFQGAVPYVAWQEDNGSVPQVYVKHWNGTDWVQDGGSLNVDSARLAEFPKLAFHDATPYVTWQESDNTTYFIYVKRWDGVDWQQVGSPVNIDSNQPSKAPSLAFEDSTPYVAWQEINGTSYQIYVKHWNGVDWEQIGGSLNLDSGQHGRAPSLAFYGPTPYVAWYEAHSAGFQIFVKHWNGSAWLQDGSALEFDSVRDPHNPALAFNGATPYVAWYGLLTNVSGAYNIRVKAFE